MKSMRPAYMRPPITLPERPDAAPEEPPKQNARAKKKARTESRLKSANAEHRRVYKGSDGRAITDVDVAVANVMRQLRTERGLSLNHIANVLNVSYQTVQQYEAAKTRLSASMLFRLCMFYDVDPNYFFKDVPTETSSEGE